MPGRITQEAYDLVFEDTQEPPGFETFGVMLARPPGSRTPMQLEEVFEPTEIGAVSPPRPVPVIWDEWRGGAGVVAPVRGVEGAYAIASNACTRFGGVTPAGGLHELALPSGIQPATLYKMLPFGNDVFIATGDDRPFVIHGGVGPVEVTTQLQAGSQTADLVVFDGALYVACGQADLARYDGSGWSQASTGNQLNRSRMAAVTWTRAGVPRRRLVATTISGTAFVYTTGDDPFNVAHWSAEVPIEAAWPIQQLVAGPRHVFAIGPGGVFDLTENGETPCITGDAWAKNYNASNGAVGVLYDGMLYVGSLVGTFAVSVDGRVVDIMEDVSIGHLQPAQLPLGGRPRILDVVDGWLIQATYSDLTQTSQLWYGMRRERTGAATPWPMTWHGSECDLEQLEVLSTCVVAPAGHPRRLYFGCQDRTTGLFRLFWQALPRYGSPLQDYLLQQADRMDYARSWSIQQTDERLGDPESMKDPLRWHVMGDHLGGANTLTVSAAGRDGVDVVQGVATTNDASFGAQRVRDTALTVTVTGANSESVPSVLEALKGSWVVTLEESATVALPVMYGPGVALLNGSEDQQDAELTFALLQRLSLRSSVRCVRWNGERMRVRIEQGARRRWLESPDGQGWLEGAVVVMTVLSRPMIHDVGDRHDVGLRHDG